MMRLLTLLFIFLSMTGLAFGQTKSTSGKKATLNMEELKTWAKEKNLSTITLGAGCFWCTEAALLQIKGVEKVVSGYSNGHVVNPTYEQVCTKLTGHVEVAQIFYDPKVVKLEQILEVFFVIHDPTSKDKQGADEGPQYRSAIFYHNDEQKAVAEKCMVAANEALAPNKVVTVLEPLKSFYPAEDYHQDYYNRNPTAGYCQYIVREKVEKVRKSFAPLLK